MLRIDPGIFQVADEFLSNPIAARKRKARSKRLAADKPTILVVDDHEITADTTAEILNRFGFRAVRTYDAQTALQIAVKLKPDFLLTDVSMPIMNGVELALEITKLLPATKILLFSGQAGTSDILREGEEKCYAFELVAKPIHPEKLMEHLKRKNDCNHTLTEEQRVIMPVLLPPARSLLLSPSAPRSLSPATAPRPPNSHVRS